MIAKLKMDANALQSFFPALLQRARAWLFHDEAAGSKLFNALLCSVGALIFILFLLILLLNKNFELQSPGNFFGEGFLNWVGVLTYVVAIAAALGILSFSIYQMLVVFGESLGSLKHEKSLAVSLVQTAPTPILLVDTNGIILLCNPATESVFRYEPGTLVGQRISKLIPERHFLHDVATSGRSQVMAFALRKNQISFPVEVSTCEFIQESPSPRQFLVTIHDASERRNSQDSVHHISMTVSSRTGEDFVRGLVQQLSQIFQYDYAFVVEVEWTSLSSTCSLLLAEHGQIRSKTTHSLIATAFKEVLDNGFAAYPQGVREQFPEDTILQSLEAESFVGTVLRDARSNPIGIVGVMHRSKMVGLGAAKQTLQLFATRAAAEIQRKKETEVLASEKQQLYGDFNQMRATAERERKRYEEDIAAEQELLSVALRSIREGCIIADNAGRIVNINPVAEALTGWLSVEIADTHLRDIVQFVGRRNHRPLEADLILEQPELLSSQMILIAKDGTERLVESTAAPIRNRENRKLGTVLVIRDVTERTRVEDERHKAEKLESLGLAAGGIAHDFNNLLTAIIGNLSLASLTAGKEIRPRIEASKKASLRAQDLAQQLLTFAKGGAPIKKTASMRQLVLDTVGFSTSGTNTRANCSIDEDLWPVDIDAGQISQVISNLSVNAIQAMSDGGTLHVYGRNLLFSEYDAIPGLRPGKYVEITVRDEGHGIPEEILKKIFDPYFTTKSKGSGLGLATSYSIIKSHDGLIGVSSKPGAGATFTIYLPASEAELVQEVVRVAPRAMRSGKILILDDEEAICELVSYALTPLGYSVAEANNAKRCLELYVEAMNSGKPFDVVIMDLTIPGGMGGKEAVKLLKQLDPSAKAIVSSGYARDPIMARYQDYGFNGVIAKPYDISELEIVIAEVIQ